MSNKRALYVCLGSACHQQGGYRLIPLLQDLLKRHRLEQRVELRGAFCLESCQAGRSLQWGGRVFSGVTEENLGDLFQDVVLPQLRPHDAGP